MKFEAMFQPIQIGPMTVANRFVMSPMGNNFANTDGTMSERSASYYGARAKGGFGLITFEATVVYKEAKGGPRKPCLYAAFRQPSQPVIRQGRRFPSSCSTQAPKAIQKSQATL